MDTSGRGGSRAKLATKQAGLLVTHSEPMRSSLDWGNALARNSNRVEEKVMPSRSFHGKAKTPAPQSSSLLVSVSRTQWTDSALAADDADLLLDDNSLNDVSSIKHHPPIVPPSLNWRSPTHVGLEDTMSQAPTQVAMGQEYSYLAGRNTKIQSNPEASIDSSPVNKFSQSSAAAQRSVLSTTKSKSQSQDYDLAGVKILPTARMWKFVPESTDSSKHGSPRTLTEMAQEDLDLDDNQDKVVGKQPSKALSRFLDMSLNDGSVMSMNQRSTLVHESAPADDRGAKLKHWLQIGQKSKSSPLESRNPYLVDLKGVVPANLNLLVPINDTVTESYKIVQNDDHSNLDHWLRGSMKKAPVNANPYLMDLKSA